MRVELPQNATLNLAPGLVVGIAADGAVAVRPRRRPRGLLGAAAAVAALAFGAAGGFLAGGGGGDAGSPRAEAAAAAAWATEPADRGIPRAVAPAAPAAPPTLVVSPPAPPRPEADPFGLGG